MSGFAIDTRELEAYGRTLEANAGIVEGAADNVIRKWSGKVVQEARRLVPVDTGNLRSSIRFDPNTRTIRAVGGAGGRVYAGYVEFGTSRMKAQPYLRPALAKYRKPFVSDMERLAKTLLTDRTKGGRAAATGGRFRGALSGVRGTKLSLSSALRNRSF